MISRTYQSARGLLLRFSRRRNFATLNRPSGSNPLATTKGDTMTEVERLRQELAQAKAENEALKQAKGKGLIVKRSDKSEGIMVLGLRKFPITFYGDEWEALFGLAPKIREIAKTLPKQAQAVG